MEAERSTALGAISRRQSVKTASWEDLVHAVVNLSVWFSDRAIMNWSYEFQESNKSDYKSQPHVYSH
jgi:hypothetical protein